jgi:hypothetical protein
METTPSPYKPDRSLPKKADYGSPTQKTLPKKMSLEEMSQSHNKQRENQSEDDLVPLCPLTIEDEANLATVLKVFIGFEMHNEKAKQQLSLKNDFNLLDAFRIFDAFNLGEIHTLEFDTGLKKLGVYAPSNEIDLLFKRYDTDCDHKLRYTEFV